MSTTHRFGDDTLTATVSADGAELRSLRDAAGAEWLWQAGPEWRRHAPMLFPIVGCLPGNALRHAGQDYPMGQHGFARDRPFAWDRREAGGCALHLSDDAASRALYPFPFRIDVAWAVRSGTLLCDVTVSNPGEAALPFSLGAHPAFAWPLPGAAGPEGHTLRFPGFDAPSLPARRLTGGFLDGSEAIPLPGGALPLRPDLFEADAIILPAFPGHRVEYAAPNGAALRMDWEGYGDLGIWTKPGAPFLCLEPWAGTTAPLGWSGEFAEKPGTTRLEPGASRLYRWSVTPKAA